MKPQHRARNALLVVIASFFGEAGCGSTLPPSLPSTEAHARSASRIDLVDLVIADEARARNVQRLYTEIEELMLTAKRTSAGEIVKLGIEDPPRTDAATRAAVEKVKTVEINAFKRYVKLQMELRRTMNADEFEKLDAIK